MTYFTDTGLNKVKSLLLDSFNEYKEVIKNLNESERKEIPMKVLYPKWENYYLGSFAEFDKSLQQYVRGGGISYEKYLPVSISHHNLHRLFEVIRMEIGLQNFSVSRIPERIMDLKEAMSKLQYLLLHTLEEKVTA